jgi:hypothetical protein
MANVDISFSEALIINKSLLATVGRLEEEAQKKEDENFDDRVAGSLLKQFLVEKHPELTAELAEFAMWYVKENGYDKDNIASGGLAALEYHNDMLDGKELQSAIKELENIKDKGLKVG